MLPRRYSYSTRPTLKPTPPQPASDYLSTRRPPNLVTHQQSFHASAAQTVETEPFVSETSSQEISPVPLRPVSFPPSHPGNSEPGRQSFRHDTQETLWSSTFEEPVSQQLPNIMSMPTPSSSQTPGIPISPVRSHQPTRSVGGFAPSPPLHHESSSDHFRHSTADYTHRFDPKFTTNSNPILPPYETVGLSEGVHAGVWATYNRISQEFDEKRLKKWNEDLDVLLIFVSLVVMGGQSSLILTGLTHDLQSSLFSAIVTAFLIRSIDDLEPDYQQQTALLLYQLLNGRDPNLATMSDPTIHTKTAGLAIAVNCLWCASITLSLSASVYAMALKWWLTEYDGGANLVGGLLRACRRQMRFKAFERLNVHALIGFLPTLLLQSISLFFIGGVLYGWQMNKIVMVIFAASGGISSIAYFLLFISPSVTKLPLFHFPKLISYRPPFAIGRVVVSFVDVILGICYISVRGLIATTFPFIQSVPGAGTLPHWNTRTRKDSPEEDRDMHVQRSTSINNPRDGIDTSQEVQEEAILWLSRVPLDPSESKALVSSLALISSSRPCDGDQEPVVILANSVLEASFREDVGQEQTDTAIDCITVLGNIKFQSVVDQNSDRDHSIGGIAVPPFVAWAAQQLTVNAFQPDSDTLYSAGIQGRLLTAAAWLSPMSGGEHLLWGDRELKIQDRSQFIEKIRMMLELHVRSDRPHDNKILIDLIHGMHACIPRGSYGRASSVVPFLSLFCENYNSSWADDEGVIRALVTYALDLILPTGGRKPLVGQKIEFDDLTSELIGALVANTAYSDVVALGLRLARRVPHAFRSRKTVLADIAHIWHRTKETIPEGYHERLNLHATDALIAVAQHHAVVNGELPRLTDYTALRLLSTALGSGYSRPMTIYTMAMILNLSASTQVIPVTNEVEVGSIIGALFSGPGDIEKGATEEDFDIRIYSALILHRLPPTTELGVDRVKGLIVQTEEAIGEPSGRDPGAAKSSEAGVGVDVDRVRWKAIYLSALLFKFLPTGERGKHIEGLRARVRALLEGGELSIMGDCGRCLEPLNMDVSGFRASSTDQQGQMSTVFEVWIGGFPLFQLAGAVGVLPPSQRRSRTSCFSSRRRFR